MISSGSRQWRIYIVKFWTRAPPGGPNSFNFMQFLENFGEIVCWRPPLGSWRPLFGEILDPPLQGGANSKGGVPIYSLAKCWQELHENEEDCPKFQ